MRRRAIPLLAACLWAAAASAGQAPPALTLSGALERARAHSPARAAARARVEAAAEALRGAGRWPNPLAELRTENFWSGAPGGMPLDSFATLTQAVEIGGDRAARRGAATAHVDAAKASQAAVDIAADLLVVLRYVEAVRGREADRALAAQLSSLDDLTRILGRRVEEGVAAEGDLHKLEAERARVDLDRVRARLDAARAFHELVALLGPGPAVSVDALAMPQVAPPDAPADADLTSALERRPDVAAARAMVASARQALRLEEARGVPDVSVTGGWKRTAGFDTGVVAATLPVPLFDRNRAAVAIAKGNLRAAELELEQTLTLGAADIRARIEAARALAVQARDLPARLLEPAAAARAAARAAFESGAADLLRLVDAERVHTDAVTIGLEVSSEVVKAAVEARIALGEVPLP